MDQHWGGDEAVKLKVLLVSWAFQDVRQNSTLIGKQSCFKTMRVEAPVKKLIEVKWE